MPIYSQDLRRDIEDAARAVSRSKRILDRVNQRMGFVGAGSELQTNDRVRHLVGKGLAHPDQLTDEETAELCGRSCDTFERFETGN